MKHNFLACPLDGLPLEQRGQSLYCGKDHCFDIDKRSAVNLLPVQYKKSLSPGDSKEMVLARRRFLDAGHYQSIADKLNTLIPDGVALDAGCGEGYYTSCLENETRIGLDISKDAIAEAAKRDKNVIWIVGTNAHIPILDRSLDAVICLFGFPVYAEFARVLKPDGTLIMADPGPEHLIELRHALYPEIHDKEKSIEAPEFTLQKTEILHTRIYSLAPKHLADLLTMTPHGHRATAERKAALLENGLPSLTLDVVFRTYKVAP